MGIQFTHIKPDNPHCVGKRFSLDQNRQIHKTSGAQLSSATATTVHVDDIQTFSAYISELAPGNALTFGITDASTAKIVTQKRLAQLHASGITSDEDGLPLIARDRQHFHYKEDGPGLMMLDYDAPKDSSSPLTKDEFLSCVYEAAPQIKDAPHAWAVSSSSCIFNSETDEEIFGIRGQRIYIQVDDAGDIPRAGKALFNRLWLIGHGYLALSSSGSILERSIIDTAVWQPERLDFVGGAHCTYPLVQRKPQMEIFNA